MGATAGGGHIRPTLNVLTALGSRQFQIPSYDAAQSYVLSNGSASLNTGTGVVTLPTGTSESTVTAYGQKGLPTLTVRTIYRRDITYTQAVFHQTGEPYTTYSTDGSNGGTWYPAGMPEWNYGPEGYYAVVTPGYYTYDGEDPVPSGYTKVGSEWTKSI